MIFFTIFMYSNCVLVAARLNDVIKSFFLNFT